MMIISYVGDRPKNVPSAVDVSYTVIITSMDGTELFQNDTVHEQLSLGFLRNTVNCETYRLVVQASNEAGYGPVSTPVVDTIHVRLMILYYVVIFIVYYTAVPDVRNVSAELKVERVQLQPLHIVNFISSESNFKF